MKMDNPQAAREDGQESAVASEAQKPRAETSAADESALDKSDEELRRLAGKLLADNLDMGASLVARCEHLAELPKGDRLKPIYAAARMTFANARIAQALANLAQVERRQRTIVERIQTPDPKLIELNSRMYGEGVDGARERLERRLDELLEQEKALDADQANAPGEAVEHEEANFAPVKQERGGSS